MERLHFHKIFCSIFLNKKKIKYVNPFIGGFQKKVYSDNIFKISFRKKNHINNIRQQKT